MADAAPTTTPDVAPRAVGAVGALVLLALSFLVGGVFGLVVMGLLLRAHRTEPGRSVVLAASAALGLLVVAALFTVLAGVPKANELTPAFAADRGVAAAAALAAGVCTLFAVAAGWVAERSDGKPVRWKLDNQAVTASVVVALGAAALAAVAVVVRWSLAPEPLRPDFADLVTNLRLGHGYARGVAPTLDATAQHPPLAPLLTAVLPGIVEQLHVIVSSLTVIATAAVGGRLAGTRGAIGAGLIAAVMPSMWGQQLPEALAALGVIGAVCFAWPDRVTPTTAGLAGVCLAVAALARPEAIVAAPIVVAWMALRTRWNTVPVAACLLTVVVLAGPWFVWTQQRFGLLQPSTSLGATLAGANAPSTVRGPLMGELDPLPAPGPGTDEGFLDGERRRAGLRAFWGPRTPVVMTARIGRAWDVWSPASVTDGRAARGLSTPGGTPGVVLEGVASVVLVAWLVARRHQWQRLLPFFALPIAFTVISAVTFGSRDLRAWTAPIVAVALGLFLAEVARRPTSTAP